jgi:hypothetical protein
MPAERESIRSVVPVANARWKKLRSGDWAVEHRGVKVRIGDVIAVTRRSGGIDRMVVRKVLWDGPGVQWLKATRATTAEGGPRYTGRGSPVAR